MTAEEIFEEMSLANKGAPIAFSGSEVASHFGRRRSTRTFGLTYLNQSDACVGASVELLDEASADESAGSVRRPTNWQSWRNWCRKTWDRLRKARCPRMPSTGLGASRKSPSTCAAS